MAQRSLGIVGAGQLAQMLIQAAKKRADSLALTVLAGHPSEPAVLEGAKPFVGQFQDEKLLESFFNSNHKIIFENEFFPGEFEEIAAKLRSLHEKENYFVPSLSTLKTLRNKWAQKKLLKNLGIPTSPFVAWYKGEAQDFLRECESYFGQDYVLKWALGGYDGKGVLLSHDESQQLSFLEKAKTKNYPVYAEKKINFKEEWAVIGCQSLSGDFVFFPFVRSTQCHGICFEVNGSKEIEAKLQEKLSKMKESLVKLAQEVKLYGSFGVELFLDQNENFWVNELAPRVHNSGHYTQDAFFEDQFDYHLKAVLGESLSPPREKCPYWGMVNLLGPEGSQGGAKAPAFPTDSGLRLHWYQKNEIRSGRKMGHLNWVANSLSEASDLRKKALEWVKNWERDVKNG